MTLSRRNFLRFAAGAAVLPSAPHFALGASLSDDFTSVFESQPGC